MGYNRGKRLFLFLAALTGILVAFRFSVLGFDVEIPDQRWMAYGLVIFFTALQLAFSGSGGKVNPTLFAGALVSYAYGIWTNIIGLYAWAGGDPNTLFGEPVKLVLPILIGIPLETVPEALMVYALYPDNERMWSDTLGNFYKVLDKAFSGGGGRNHWQAPRPGYRPPQAQRPRPTVGDMRRSQPHSAGMGIPNFGGNGRFSVPDDDELEA